jgi:hypothetical protein
METNNQQVRTDEFAGVDTEETPSQPSCMQLSEFLPALFCALEKEGVHFCVLRNYERFPACNNGRDIDCLIRASDLPLAIRALKSIQGIRIVGYSERSYVANIFLEGISSTAHYRALQVDFYLSLTWKGLVYLPTDAVLQAAVPRPAGNSTFLVPSTVHEAITSLLTSLIIGGSVREKYFPQVQRTFASKKAEVIAALMPQFGARAATSLTNSVIAGDRERILGYVKTLRASLVLRSFVRRPLRSTLAVARHYACEVAIRYSPRTLETVCILSLGSCDEDVIIDALIPILQSSAVVVEKRAPGLQLLMRRDSAGRSVAANCDTEAPYCRLAFMARIVRSVMEEWLSQFNRMPALRVIKGHSFDLIIGAEWHRYGIPRWFARLVWNLLPTPDLWVFLDPKTEQMRATNRECPCSQTLRQLSAYRSFGRMKDRYVILEAPKPGFCVTEKAYSAIIDMLVRRSDTRLRKRF